MNIQKHKSVAVRKEDHETLTALCGKEHRGPAQYMSLLIKKEIERRARLKKMTPEAYRTKIMKCRGNHYVLKEGLDKSKKDLHLDPKNFINCSSCIDNSKNAS